MITFFFQNYRCLQFSSRIVSVCVGGEVPSKDRIKNEKNSKKNSKGQGDIWSISQQQYMLVYHSTRFPYRTFDRKWMKYFQMCCNQQFLLKLSGHFTHQFLTCLSRFIGVSSNLKTFSLKKIHPKDYVGLTSDDSISCMSSHSKKRLITSYICFWNQC